MKKLMIVMCALVLGTGAFAQGLKGIYNNSKSPAAKYEAAAKLGNLGLADQFAFEKIRFTAGKSTQVNLNKMVYRYETLFPTQKEQLEKDFPGICAWYEDQAAQNNTELFVFTTKVHVPFDDLESIINETEPAGTGQKIKYLTKKIQRELFNSENILIGNNLEKLKGLYLSLNKGDKEMFQESGYDSLWQEQLNCYFHKQNQNNCTCGGKHQPITEFVTCSPDKNLSILSTKKVDPDEATELLLQFNSIGANLNAAIATARQKQYFVWANVNKEIPKELCFLQLAVLGEIKVFEHAKINLKELWEAAKRDGSSKYLEDLGFTDQLIAETEDYYRCVLQQRRVLTKETYVPSVTAEKKPDEEHPKNMNGLSREIIKLPRKEAYTAYKLHDAVKAFLEEEITNREEELEGTCLDAKATSDTTYEVILNRCDSTSQVFEIQETENLAIANFFKYCSNIVVGELERASTVVPMSYSIVVTGTADQLAYDKNQELADSRAQYVLERLGERTQTATSITPLGIIDLPVGMRFVSLTFTLTKNNTTAIAKQ